MTDNTPGASDSSTAAWERLSRLFEAAQSLPPESREQYLDAVCEGNPGIRSELSALLAASPDAPAFLQQLAESVVAPAVARIAASHFTPDIDGVPAAPARIGSRVRHYEIREQIGSGGMGVVYLGRDTRLDRDVALKFVAPTRFTDDAARQQLVREAQAVSALDDANICAMYAIEDDDDGGICLVMAHCAGGTLRGRTRNRLLPIAEAMAIATQIASGLACAHRQGIVHRDLKPANVGFADRGVVKLLDFGIASRVVTQTTTGNALVSGTLPYMAPELLRGDSPTARADVWALGVTCFEMLTGRRPFDAPTDAGVMYAILEQEPPPMDRDDGVPVPDALVRLIHLLLHKDPRHRPASGAEALIHLQAAWPGGSAAVPVPAPTVYHPTPAAVNDAGTALAPEPWYTRTRYAALGSLLFVAALGAWTWTRRAPVSDALVPALEVARSTEPLPTIAVLPFAIQGDSAMGYLHEGIVDLLTPVFDATGLLRGIDPNTVLGADARPATGAARSTRLDSATARNWAARVAATRYVVGAVVDSGETLTMRATMFLANGEERGRALTTMSSAGSLARAMDALVRQLVSAELRAPGDTLAALAATTTTSSIALRAYLDGEREFRDARPVAAVSFFQQAVAADSMFALAWYRLARAAKWSEVDSLNRFAIKRAFTLAPTLPPRLQSITNAYYAARIGHPSDAERSLRQIVAAYPTDVEAWMLLGEVLFETNPFRGRQRDDATSAFRTVMSLDPRNREVTVYLMELAARANRTGELDTLFTMYFSPNSAGEQPGIRQTYLALHARRVADGATSSSRSARIAQRAGNGVDDPAAALIALRRVGSDEREIATAVAFARTAATSSLPTARREGLLSLASLLAAGGQRESPEAAWNAAEQLDASATIVAQTLAALSPRTPFGPDRLRVLHEQLVSLASKQAPAGINLEQNGLSSAEGRAVLWYLVGVLSVRVGAERMAERAVQQLTRGVGNVPLATVLARAVRGHRAMVRKQYAEAAAEFSAGLVDLPARVLTVVPALQQQVDRLAYVQALRALQRDSEADAWFASLRDLPTVWTAPYLRAPFGAAKGDADAERVFQSAQPVRDRAPR